eukprot:1139220-Pelagomonas_calceolata.AAC.7
MQEGKEKATQPGPARPASLSPPPGHRGYYSAIWSNSTSPVCDICDFADKQDERHVLFNCSNPQICSF